MLLTTVLTKSMHIILFDICRKSRIAPACTMFHSSAETQYEHALNINIEFGTFFQNQAFHSIEAFYSPG